MVISAYSHKPFYNALTTIGYNILGIFIIIFVGLILGEIYPILRRFIYNVVIICIINLLFHSYYITKKLISRKKNV